MKRVYGGALAVLVSAAAGVAAEAPTLTHLYPVAGKQGSTCAVTFAGKFDPWPPSVWVDTAGITCVPTPITGIFNVEIAPDAAPGPHLVRVINEQGASAPRFFIVSRDAELRDTEPNDLFSSPQNVAALPATINGRLDKSGDVDSFAVTLKRGETLVARVEAFMLGSAFDGMLRLIGTDGTPLAFNHDGRTLDPFLAWEAPRDGVFIVQVMGFAFPPSSDVRLTGGENCVYRLHLTAGPFVRHTVPLAAQRGQKTTLQLVGWNLSASAIEFDAAQGGVAPDVELPGVLMAAPLRISDAPELLESEPAGTGPAAQLITVPSAVTACIQQPKDEDRFAFTAVKERIYEFKVTSYPCGSPLDAWLAIEGADGKELARNDDVGNSPDPQLMWTAPSDGTFTVAIGDVTHRGGAGFVYRLAIGEAVPSFEATTAAHSLAIAPGKTAELKVAIKRTHGFAAKLQLAAQNLPAGVSAEAVEISEKATEATLKLVADPAATPANQPFAISVQEAGGELRRPVRCSARGADENYTEAVIDWTDQLWITVLTEPPK